MREKFIEGVLSQFLHDRQQELQKRNESLQKSFPNILKHIKDLAQKAEHQGNSFFYMFSDKPGLHETPMKGEGVKYIAVYGHGVSPTLEDLYEAKSKYVIKVPHESLNLLDLAHPVADEKIDVLAEKMVQDSKHETKWDAILDAAKQHGFSGVFSSASKRPGLILFFDPMPIYQEIKKPQKSEDIKKWAEANH